jgi:thiamine-monophosphate kinase
MKPADKGRRLSEDGIIRILKARFPARNRLVETGIGDDAAVLRALPARKRWIVTTDMLLEGVDFRQKWTTPVQLGYKALAVNLSDLAAMGAVPLFYTVALALPRPVDPAWIRSFFKGVASLGRRSGADLIGGDLSSSRAGISIAITAIGTPAGRRAVRRSGGRAGDLLYVTGTLGRSAAGLKLLQSGILQGRGRAERDALRAHRTPAPRCEVGAWLGRSGLPHCMMDLSDGLSVDLPRLCTASGTGAEICAASLPRFAASTAWRGDPMDLALHGGEDFELLFAVSPAKASILGERYPSRFPPISRIGTLTAGGGVRWKPAPGAESKPLETRGYDHFGC